MNVVDSSAWLEFFADGPNAGNFAFPMADSIILATARQHKAVLWTQDEHFQGIPDVRYFPKQ